MAECPVDLTFAYIVISAVGIISNMLLAIAFIKDPLKCFRNSATYLVMNLSFSDLLTCSFYPFLFRGTVIGGLDSYFYTLCFSNASLASIASISIDRFLIVVYPLQYRQWINGKRMLVWLTVIWLAAFVLPIIQLFYDEPIVMYLLSTFAFLNIVLSILMYAVTYSNLKKHSTEIGRQNSTESRAQKIRVIKEKRILKTIILIGSVTFICTVPSLVYFELNDYLNLAYDTLVHKILYGMFTLIFNVNFAVNPIIYILRLGNYRKAFHLVYCSKLQIVIYGHTDTPETQRSDS